MVDLIIKTINLKYKEVLHGDFYPQNCLLQPWRILLKRFAGQMWILILTFTSSHASDMNKMLQNLKKKHRKISDVHDKIYYKSRVKFYLDYKLIEKVVNLYILEPNYY